MKTVVGVDLAEHYESALETCLELDFPNQQILFVHAVEPLPPQMPPMPEGVVDGTAWTQQLKREGEALVTKAEARTCHKHVSSNSMIVEGPAAATIMNIADEQGADLVAIRTMRKSKAGQYIPGSVARALTIGARQSILVTKGDNMPKRPLHAIFATDHSDYANQALNQLIGWAPRGLSQIDVLTAYDVDERRAGTTANTDEAHDSLEKSAKQRLQEKGDEVAQLLVRSGYTSEVRVVKGHANAVLAEQMVKSEADLLIMGAQGHGFLERLLVGSTSLHQVTAEPYPVLIIRR